MSTATAEHALGRKKSGRKTSAVKIDASIAMKAARVAEDRGIPVSEYLTEMVRDRVEREWLKIVKRADELERKDQN